MAIEVTDVRIRKTYDEGKMKAIASVTLGEEFVIHDVRVIEGSKGLFVAMPSKRRADGEFKDIAHPITTPMRNRIQEAVIKAYETELNNEERIVV